MKKILILTMTIAATLFAASAYAREGGPASREENGITVFSTGPIAFDDVAIGPAVLGEVSVEGSAAGGMREDESAFEPNNNGVTLFSLGPMALDDYAIGPMAMSVKRSHSVEGSAAGGIREEGSALEPYNGTTVFSTGPVAFDNGTTETSAIGSYK
jgi:hypothetical protein